MCRTLWHIFTGQMEEEETEKRVARETEEKSGRNNATLDKSERIFNKERVFFKNSSKKVFFKAKSHNVAK